MVIGTPCYGGTVTAGFCHALAATCLHLQGLGIAFRWEITEAESLVQRARNLIAARFLAWPAATHLIWIDADIEWQARDVERLLAHDVDVVGGLYAKKTLPVDFPWHPRCDERGVVNRDPRTGRIEIANAPTGFLCTKRAVYERMQRKNPESKIVAMHGIEGAVLDNLFDYFPAALEEGILWSEDYGFCRRWHSMGGQVWMDPAIKLLHRGQHAYTGDPMTLFEVAPDSAAA